MAKEPIKPTAKPAEIEQAAPETKAQEKPLYTVDELAINAPKLFNQHEDLARAALEFAKVEQTTIDEAKKIIKDFAERTVN